MQTMTRLPEHNQAVSLNFQLDEADEDVHPQESKQFDGQQLPIAPEEYEKVMEQVVADKDKLLDKAKLVLGKTNHHLWTRLNSLYDKNLHSFRAQLMGEGAIQGIPIVATPLVQGAEKVSFRHKTRVYNTEQMEFLSNLCKQFVKAGMVVRCEPQRTSSPVLVVKKPNGKGFRMVIDLRMANKLVEELAAPAIHMDMVRDCLAGSR